MIVPLLAIALNIAFPGEGCKFTGVKETYVIGSCATNQGPLYVNGEETEIYHTGCFLAMVKLAAGTNSIVLEQGYDMFTRKVVVMPPAKTSAKPSKPHDMYKDLAILSDVKPPKEPPYGKAAKDIVILIDPGHGLQDSGALTPHGWREKDVNLLQAKAIAAELSKQGYQIYMTRNEDMFPALYDRPKMAWMLRADAFISVHHNATAANSNPRTARHTTTYAYNDMGYALAECIQQEMAKVLAPIRDGGTRKASFAVCRNPVVPSCLLEVDFINLPEGEEESWNPARHKLVAEAVAHGVNKWLKK